MCYWFAQQTEKAKAVVDRAMQEEIDVLSNVKHPHLVELQAVVVDEGGKRIGFTMPLAKGRTVFDIMVKRSPFFSL